jgi:hypothetical protein
MLLIASCQPEDETRVIFRFMNETMVSDVEITSYFNGMERIYFSNSQVADPIETLDYDGIYESFPVYRANVFLLSDSAVVVFNDTLRVIHRIIDRNQEISELSDRENIIWFDDDRNIYNLNSYDIDRLQEDEWRADYRITQEDLEYAIEVNE